MNANEEDAAQEKAIQDAINEEVELARLGISGHLAKACADPFVYAIGLKNGHVIMFHAACVHPGTDWLTLEILNEDQQEDNEKRLGHKCPRGLSVRISEIAWCADAPDGS